MEKSLETLFRAFAEYKKTTSLDVESVRFKRSNSTSGGKAKEDIVVYFSTCTINEDWVAAIERGIPFIQKCIQEERQFIRNDGEVLPIEKIRKTSTSSIQDLAKHSNYITHEPDEKAHSSVMPDKMLMIQKESDYAVYENRVVYTALVYLRDFVSRRLNSIKELTNKYESNSYYKRKIDFGNRKMNIDFSLHEERLEDPNFIDRNSAKAVIERLDDILSNILVLLKTPLMQIVSKSDTVKRPITKTNVLKMNRNFREALACFDYIADYQGDGFTIQRVEKSCSPFKTQLCGDVTEAVMLTSFITYMYGLGMEGELDKAYQEYLKQEKLDRENEILNKIKSIKTKAEMDGKTLEQYLVDLEEAYHIIEGRLEKVDEVIRDLKLTHKKEIEDLNKEHDIAVNQIKTECENKIDEIEQECEKKMEELTAAHEQSLKETIENCQKDMETYKAQCDENYKNVEQDLRDKYAALKAEADEKVAKYAEESAKNSSENKTLTKTNAAYNAEIISLKRQLNRDSVNPAEFVTKEDFINLEKDREAFMEFFGDAWKEAKKYLRKTHLRIDRTKKENGKDAE